MESLSNYLPDDDDPEYWKFEQALPKYKKELEQRYPQICRKCAPKAQSKINRADYYAGAQNLAMLGRKTQARRGASAKGMRDDWGKWSMRRLLKAVGLVYYASVLAQVAWHIYGIFTVSATPPSLGDEMADLAFDATPRDCVDMSLRMHFDESCYELFSTYMTRALITSACLIWFNPALKDWFHHTHRIEAITGQKEYFRMQFILLAARAIAYWKLSDSSFTASLTTHQVMAAHGFMVLSIPLLQWVCNHTVKPVNFKLKLNMMPRPEERDVLGAWAGPEDVGGTPQASSIPPSQLFARDRVAPFPIANLAPKRGTYQKSSIPSPPPSDETDDEGDVGDAMDVDWQSSTQPQMPGTMIDRTYRPRLTPPKPKQPVRSMYNHGSTQGLGWSGVRDELFGIQDNLSLELQRKRQEEEQRAKLKYQPQVQQSPFHGTLPQAPMSMERKLRNPVNPVTFKKTPLSKQQDFLQQMRNGITGGKAFEREQQQQEMKSQYAQKRVPDEYEEEFSPAKQRTRGELQLKESSWKLKTDESNGTGLEDLFGGTSFRIADEPAIVAAARERAQDYSGLVKWAFGTAVAVVVGVLFWGLRGFRRTVCLRLVGKLEETGW